MTSPLPWPPYPYHYTLGLGRRNPGWKFDSYAHLGLFANAMKLECAGRIRPEDSRLLSLPHKTDNRFHFSASSPWAWVEKRVVFIGL